MELKITKQTTDEKANNEKTYIVPVFFLYLILFLVVYGAASFIFDAYNLIKIMQMNPGGDTAIPRLNSMSPSLIRETYI